MGGIGKTTLALALFTRLKHGFEASFFIENVKDKSASGEEKELLPDYAKDGGLRHKKVLIVLDDVDKREQLEILDHDRYGPGSRIIITSRHIELLENGDAIYEVPGLTPAEASQLLELRAVANTSINEGYLNLSREREHLKYANGLPLAIHILSSRHFDKPEPSFYDILLDVAQCGVREAPNHHLIRKLLRVSFDGLEENMKSIFLDIVCFFQGDDKDVAKRILDGCGFSADRGINYLIDRSLVIMKDSNKLHINSWFREMAEDIVWQQSPTEPGWRSRLWRSPDIYHIFRRNTATAAIEGIFLDMSRSSELDLSPSDFKLDLSPSAFKKMENLRILKFRNRFLKQKLQFPHGLQSLPDALRYLYWDGYPFESLPLEFSGKYLVELKMQYSQVEQLWKGNQVH